MSQFSGKHHFTRRIIDDGYPCGLAAWIKFETQGFKPGLLDSFLQKDREGIAFEHRSFAGREQDARSSRMDRVQCLFVGIEYKNFAHVSLPFGVMVASSMFVSGFNTESTGLTRYTCLTLRRSGWGWPRTPTCLYIRSERSWLPS